MEQSLQMGFVSKLEEKYGKWDKTISRFGSTSFGEVSQDLSISSSQFSKLIYGTATEGMYQRTIKNIDRLIEKESIREKLKEILAENENLKEQLNRQSAGSYKAIQKIALFAIILGGVLGLIYILNISSKQEITLQKDKVTQHPLAVYFDQDFSANFNSPYLTISEVQKFCPASAYEGVWSLSESYKLPLPGSKKPGLYYLAKSADVRMKCSRFDTIGVGRGRVLYGYEYLVNEIWLDTKNTPLSPTFFDKENKVFTPEFESLDFEKNPQFKKIATIHSFFTDKFFIYPDSIVRKGEPCGRYASDIAQDLVIEYEIDIKYILDNVLANLTTTSCSATTNPFPNPNDLKADESVINFECLYTINAENLGIGGGYPYRKGYRLEKQNYTDNLICN
jgi:hypothetical protein